MSRAAIAILSTENLHHNLAVLKKMAPNSKIMAMIKANAYGHGLRSVALRLDQKVDSLGVASIDEALALRKIGVKNSVTLIEGVFEPDELIVASSQGFHVVFHDTSQINWLESATLPLPITAWVKINTGMGRLGFALDEVKSKFDRIKRHPQIKKSLGLMSHFACADDLSHPLNQIQANAFSHLAKQLNGPKSLANSPALIQMPETHYEVVRPGLALYGVSPVLGHTAADYGLRPVMTLQTRLISCHTLKKGSSIGYGSQFICPQDMPVGVIAMGYGDGYPRTAQNGTPVLVNQTKCQIVGRVSMDMATIDLRPYPQAKTGDPVVLWGNGLPIEEVASHTAHVAYDLLCAIQPRVKFHWTHF